MKQSTAAESEHQQNDRQQNTASHTASASQAFVDNRESTAQLHQLMAGINGSSKIAAQRQTAGTLHYSPRMMVQRQHYQSISKLSEISNPVRPLPLSSQAGVSESAKNVAQRKVIVNGSPAVLSLPGHTAIVNGDTVPLEKDKSEWIYDRYTRTYQSTEEFRNHVSGAPVDVGLARKLGRWYRLPFFSSGEFFVLGENHAAFGYRELIRESNQQGLVLGEGGSNKLMSATPDSPLEFNSTGLKDDSEESREHTMENLVAKAYFAFAALKENYEKEAAGNSSSGSSKPEKSKLPEKEWLKNYQNVSPDKRGVGSGLAKLPYYLNDSNEKVFAIYGTKAENYDVTKTVTREVDKFAETINDYRGEQSEILISTKEAVSELQLIQRDDPNNYPRLLRVLDVLLGWMLKLSFSEARKLKGEDPDVELKARFAVVKQNQKKWGKEMQKAMAHRDYVMYQSVLKAKDDHIMAGMGNHHVKNLKESLEQKDITVVLFDEFVSNAYSSDAIAPVDHGLWQEQQNIDESVDAVYQMLRNFPGPYSPKRTEARQEAYESLFVLRDLWNRSDDSTKTQYLINRIIILLDKYSMTVLATRPPQEILWSQFEFQKPKV